MDLYTENRKQGKKLPIFLEDDASSSLDTHLPKIVLIEAGSCIVTISGKEFVISAPALFCLNAGEDFNVIKSERSTIRVLYFDPGIVNSHFNADNIHLDPGRLPDTVRLDHFYFIPFVDRGNSCKWNGGNDPGRGDCRDVSGAGYVEIGPVTCRRISDMLESIKAQLGNTDDYYWPCRSRSLFIELLFLIQHCYSKKEDLSGIPLAENGIGDILLYLHMNYKDRLTIDGITREFQTNRNTLNKKFRSAVGMPVIEYIVRLRIKMACTLLRDTKLPVSEIMARAGFNDVSYWGRTFRKYSGMTPSEYRKSQT